MTSPKMRLLPALIALTLSGAAGATTYTDNFQGASASLSWVVGTPASGTNAACLTAGSGFGTIPACTSNTDTAGNGALRLTPASGNQFGNIVSNFSFASNQGLQVTFTTYTYGGDKGGTAKNGADGIGFFLMDGSVAANIGATGGSLGYSCSNVNNASNGLMGAYLGLGIDEYGNFLNSSDNTNTGIINSNDSAYTGGNTYGSNSYYNGSKYYQPQRIGLRGAGNVSWPWLQANYPLAFSGAFDTAKVKSVCSTGQFSNPVAMAFPSGTNLSSITYSWLRSNYPSYYPKTSNINSTQQSQAVTYAQQNQIWNFSSPSSPVQVFTNQTVTVPNYAAIPGGYRLLPNGSPIANENTSTRANAWPITYKLIITPTGYLSFSYSYNNGVYQPVLANKLITSSNGPLPATFKFGFSGSTGGSTNVHEITCFTAQPIQSSSSAAANTIQSGQVQTGTQIYLASYNANNWWGGLTSNDLVVSGSGTVSAATTANWDASCTLTGGACSSTGASSTTLLTPANRQLLTWSGSSGLAFESGSLTSIQTGILNSNTTGSTAIELVNWLRGDRTNEQGQSTGTGALRLRSSVLGDIINSSPVWIGAPSAAYSNQFNDSIYGINTPENATGAQTYNTYAQNNATRTNVVYSGSNDGFLHGFRSGSYNTNGTYNSGNNDGQEVLGFMPYGVLANITGTSSAPINNLTAPTYSHNYFVDATPGSGDLFYNGTWHTWLVGGLGSGGKEIYALDVTDPTQFAETNAASLVMGDWTADSTAEQTALTCTNASGCNANLGYTYGTPLIRRLHNGKWAIIFGNGLDSSTGRAGVYIGLINSSSGTNPPTFTFYWLDTGIGSTSSPDGINFVTSADLDGDKVTDYLYGGDLQGNIWRFDLTSSNPADWGVSKYGNTTPTPLFTATIGGVAQPITTQLSSAWTNVAGQKQAIIMFGTGQKIQATATTPDTYATGTQSVYGIWDWDMTAWNNGTTTTSGVAIPASGTPYRALTAPQTIARSDLQSQTATTLSTTPPSGGQVQGYRTTTANTVCWGGTSTCATGNTQYGWYLDLPSTQEQVIYNPIIDNGALVLNTTIPPSTSSTSSCSVPTTTGWTMSFNIATGGSFPQSFFQNSSGVFSVGSGGSSISGIMLSGVGSPGLVSVGSQQYTYFQTSPGKPAVAPTNPQNGIIPSRVMWEQLR